MKDSKKKKVEEYFTALIDHLRNRDPDEAKRLVEEHPELLTYVDDTGRLALHWACSCGSLPFVQMILSDSGKSEQLINREDDVGWTPLMIASSAGHASVVKYLLTFPQCNVNLRNKNGQTALHYACSKDHVAIARMLLDNNADLNATDRYGSTPLHQLVLNQPDFFDAEIEELLSATPIAEEVEAFNRRFEAVKKVFMLEPDQAERFLSAMIDGPSPKLVVAVKFLCSELCSADFFIDTLISHFIKRDDALTAFVTRSHRNSMRKVCERYSSILTTIKQDRSGTDLHERMMLLMSLLCSHSSLRLSTEECHQWAYYLTHQPTTSTDGVANMHKMTLAVILACPNITPNQQAFRDEQVENYLIDYFQSLRELASSSSSSSTTTRGSDDSDSLGRMMLLVAIHMSTNKGDELANLVSSVLGFKVGETLRKLFTVKKLYLNHAVTERDIAEKAARLGVTRTLNAKSSGYLPVHCINHLLSSRAFSKHDIPIQEWIKSQMLECTAPVHPIMTNLLKNFSSTCVPTPEYESFNAAIEEEFFWEIFSSDIFDFDRRRRSIVVQLLALFYLIAYTYKLETTCIGVITSSPNNGGEKRGKYQPQPYSARLWARIPIRYLLLVLDARHEDYAAFRPVMLRFIAASMPHMLPNINSTLHNIDVQVAQYNDVNYVHIEQSGVTAEHLHGALDEFARVLQSNSVAQSSCSLMNALNRIDRAPINEQYRHWSTIVQAMEVTLSPATPRHVKEMVARIWQRLENLIPRCLYEATLQRWLSTEYAAISGVAGKAKRIHVDNELLLAETPLLLFRVDERVFRSPPHLRCFMHMLSFYLEATKNANNLRLLKATTVTHSKAELEEKAQLFKSLIGAQYLTVVQLLLELCDGEDLLEGGGQPDDELAEIREVCCSQIHQMFIADSLLPKLVHFNTYPPHLIPVMVRGVPSAHVLIGFLGDLLTGASLERRVFAVCLMAELIQKYKIPMAFAGVGLISDVLDTLLSCYVDEEHIILFLHITRAIVRLAKVSPFHAGGLIETMERVRKFVHSRLALYVSVVAANESPERRLADMLNAALAESRGLSCAAAVTPAVTTVPAADVVGGAVPVVMSIPESMVNTNVGAQKS